MMLSKFGRLIVGLEPVVFLAFGVYAGVAYDRIRWRLGERSIALPLIPAALPPSPTSGPLGRDFSLTADYY